MHLELKGITKRFPGVVANDGMTFDVSGGEIHALLGENGAGKTTLMNILYGLARPDEGEILIDGTAVRIANPTDAISRGINMVHQHFMLVPVLTVAENFLAQNKDVDVLFQVAGLTGNGVLDAACAANIKGIGVDVDQLLSYPNAAPCLLTSAEKHLELAVSSALEAKAAGTLKAGTLLYDAKNDGIGVSPGHDNASAWAPDTQAKIDAALAGMKDGSLKTCPDKCGSL